MSCKSARGLAALALLALAACQSDLRDFSQPPEDDDMTETITLKVGSMTLAGGGKSKSFKVPEFSKK